MQDVAAASPQVGDASVSRVSSLWLLLALVLLAMNLRSPLTAVPPVLESMRADLALGPALCGLLTSIPVLCFGLSYNFV